MAKSINLLVPFRRRTAAAAICLASVGFAAAAPATDRAGTVSVAGTPRAFIVHVPDGTPPPGGYPVILAFHGGGTQGAWMERLTGFDRLADTRGFIIVYPNGIDRHWNDGRSTIKNPQNDVGFVSALLDQLGHDYRIDTGRIYATGISNGALFAQRLGCDLGQRIAAIAPVAGTLPTDIQSTCHPAARVAVLQIGGTADPIMPFDGGAVADFGGKGEGGQVLSVTRTAAFWAQANGCGAAGAPEPMPPLMPLDPTRIARARYVGCPEAGRVTILTVNGGGHTWPGGPQYAPAAIVGRTSRQFDASRAIVNFFFSLPPR